MIVRIFWGKAIMFLKGAQASRCTWGDRNPRGWGFKKAISDESPICSGGEESGCERFFRGEKAACERFF